MEIAFKSDEDVSKESQQNKEEQVAIEHEEDEKNIQYLQCGKQNCMVCEMNDKQ